MQQGLTSGQYTSITVDAVTDIIWFKPVDHTIVADVVPGIVVGIELSSPRLVCLCDVAVSPPCFS